LAPQIISSRKPLPTSVLLTPRTNFLPLALPDDPLVDDELLLLPLPQPAATSATKARPRHHSTPRVFRILTVILLLQLLGQVLARA
jgi:hypothetical protein